MLALLHKDFLMLRKEKMVWFIFLLALLGGLASGSQPGAALLLLFFPVYWATAYSNAYDYKYGAEAVLTSLPLSRGKIVGAKYALGAAAAILSALVALAGGLPLSLFHVVPGRFSPGFIIAALGLCSLFSAVSLAAYFRFGYLKSRWIVIGLFVAPGILVGIVTGSSGAVAVDGAGVAAAVSGFFSGLAAPAMFLGVSLAALGLSFLYSRWVFGKKEF